jgi:hypothetical protein
MAKTPKSPAISPAASLGILTAGIAVIGGTIAWVNE